MSFPPTGSKRVDRLQERDRGGERRNPDDARTIPIVRPRQRTTTSEGIREERDRHGNSKMSQLVEAPANQRVSKQHEDERRRVGFHAVWM